MVILLLGCIVLQLNLSQSLCSPILKAIGMFFLINSIISRRFSYISTLQTLTLQFSKNHLNEKNYFCCYLVTSDNNSKENTLSPGNSYYHSTLGMGEGFSNAACECEWHFPTRIYKVLRFRSLFKLCEEIAADQSNIFLFWQLFLSLLEAEENVFKVSVI